MKRHLKRSALALACSLSITSQMPARDRDHAQAKAAYRGRQVLVDPTKPAELRPGAPTAGPERAPLPQALPTLDDAEESAERSQIPVGVERRAPAQNAPAATPEKTRSATRHSATPSGAVPERPAAQRPVHQLPVRPAHQPPQVRPTRTQSSSQPAPTLPQAEPIRRQARYLPAIERTQLAERTTPVKEAVDPAPTAGREATRWEQHGAAPPNPMRQAFEIVKKRPIPVYTESPGDRFDEPVAPVDDPVPPVVPPRKPETVASPLPPVAAELPTAGSEHVIGLAANAARQHNTYASQLARRGAIYSARDEHLRALRTVAVALDSVHKTRSHTMALESGLRALSEANDFSRQSMLRGQKVVVSAIAAGHDTPILKTDQRILTPIEAMQQYFRFAQEQLVASAGGQAAASDAICGLARIDQMLRQGNGVKETLGAAKSVSLYQAALAVDTHNFVAANELGVLMARYGELHRAEHWLRHSMQLHPNPMTDSNLVQVLARLGVAEAALETHTPHTHSPAALQTAQLVRVVDRQEFQHTGAEVNASGEPEVQVTVPEEQSEQSPLIFEPAKKLRSLLGWH